MHKKKKSSFSVCCHIGSLFSAPLPPTLPPSFLPSLPPSYPPSPGIVRTLTVMVFGVAGRRIVELYAAAAEHYPKNAEILTHLFMSYVRIGDYQKQQQVRVYVCVCVCACA